MSLSGVRRRGSLGGIATYANLSVGQTVTFASSYTSLWSHMQVASGSGTLASSCSFVHPIAVSSVSSRAHALGDTLARRQSVRPMKSSTSEGDHAVPVTRQSTDQRVRAPFHRWEREFLVMQTAATFKCGPEGGSCGGEISWTDGTRLPIAARIHLLHTSCMKGA